jgi:hypothetical protein
MLRVQSYFEDDLKPGRPTARIQVVRPYANQPLMDIPKPSEYITFGLDARDRMAITGRPRRRGTGSGGDPRQMYGSGFPEIIPEDMSMQGVERSWPHIKDDKIQSSKTSFKTSSTPGMQSVVQNWDYSNAGSPEAQGTLPSSVEPRLGELDLYGVDVRIGGRPRAKSEGDLSMKSRHSSAKLFTRRKGVYIPGVGKKRAVPASSNASRRIPSEESEL